MTITFGQVAATFASLYPDVSNMPLIHDGTVTETRLYVTINHEEGLVGYWRSDVDFTAAKMKMLTFLSQNNLPHRIETLRM